MKRLALLMLPGLLLGAAAAPLSAQEDKPPPTYFIHSEFVKASMFEQYEDATKELIGLLESSDVDPAAVGWMAVWGPQTGYAYVMPVEGMGGIGKLYASWESAVAKVGAERWQRVAARAEEAIDHVESSVLVLRPDLSYKLETTAMTPEMPYRHYYWWYVIPGKGEGLESVAKEFAELYAANGIETGWRMYQAAMGSDLPLYLVVFAAKDPAEFHAWDRETTARLGEEADRLYLKALSYARRVEEGHGWVRGDLSFPPP